MRHGRAALDPRRLLIDPRRSLIDLRTLLVDPRRLLVLLPLDRAGGWRLSRRALHVLAAAAVLAVVAMAAGAWFMAGIINGLPDDEAIRGASRMAEATRVYDRNDRLAFSIFQERRIEVPLEEISPWLVNAVIAIEDRRFYDHAGLDYIRIAGAAWANLWAGRAAQGASTITQQLARQSLLSGQKTLRRKVSEALLAARFERHYSKREILRLYLNKVYFGNGFYGAEAASLGYFGVHAADLTLPEAALLAGLIKSPSAYAPTENLERAVARRNVVLRAMLETGVIDRATWARAREERVVLQNLLEAGEAHGRHFKEHVRRELVSLFGWERVYQGGLRVYTTLDPDMQRAAEASVRKSLEEIEALRARRLARSARRAVAGTSGGASDADPDAEPLQAAVVALDADTGEVRALVGGRDFSASSFNRAVQARRQPGSAFKPFVFARALESGFTPATIISDLDVPVDTAEGPWTPDDGHGEADQMTLRAALRVSSNRAAVRLLDSLGIEQAIRYARTVGMTDLPPVPSLALGSGEVTLLSLTAAYVPFATSGVLHPPVFIRRVDDAGGSVLYASRPAPERVLSEATAFQMAQMLADVINSGTGYAVRRRGFTLPAAGKTGTTNGYNDAWFVGFTPSLVSGVWIGYDKPRTIVESGYAADLAAPLWADFMKAATKGDPPRWLEMPADIVPVEVCRLSGMLPNSGCHLVRIETGDGESIERSTIYTEYFRRGTAPTEECPLHPGRSFFQRFIGAIVGRDGAEAVAVPPPPASRASELLPGDVTSGEGVANEAVAGDESQTTDSRVRVKEKEEDEKADQKPKKKRGFWARLFGIGSSDDDERKDGDRGKETAEGKRKKQVEKKKRNE